jgi:hypothetical protein
MSIEAFFETICDDPRITTAHVSVYLAMLSEFQREDTCGMLLVNRVRIMQLAKINARSTYDKVMNDLNDFGYIKYYPAFGRKSKIKFNKL